MGTTFLTRPRFVRRRGYAAKIVIAGLLVAALCSIWGAQAVDAKPFRLVVFGDSLTAGYGLRPGDAFPEQLARALQSTGHQIDVINSGVSGDTTAAGLARFDWAMPDDADAVIVELGANDALRGIEPAEARANLDEILKRLRERGLRVLLAGMRAPTNWGEDYRRQFDAIFPDLAARHGVALYPFFLDGIVLDPALNQADGIHPNAAGVAEIVKRISPFVEEMIKAPSPSASNR